VGILGLPHSGDDAFDDERGWVKPGLRGKFELLFRVERSGVAIIGGEEVRQSAEEALLFLNFDLRLGEFGLGLGDVDFRGEAIDGLCGLRKVRAVPSRWFSKRSPGR
jgi:hypothetical protein